MFENTKEFPKFDQSVKNAPFRPAGTYRTAPEQDRYL